MSRIIFGSNSFETNTNFTILGKDENGGIVFGGFGPKVHNPIVWVNIVNGKGLLNANISDTSGELVLKIENSKVIINKDNIYTVETIPENQIPPDQVIVVNQYGETALDLSSDGDTIIINADLYEGTDHVVATNEGTYINPDHPFV